MRRLPSPYWRWAPHLGPAAHVSIRWPLGTDGNLLCEVFERFGYKAAAGRDQYNVLPEWTLAKRLTYCDRHDCMIKADVAGAALCTRLAEIGATLTITD